MDISNNMLMAIVVVAVIVAAVFAFLFKGTLSTAYGKFKLRASGGGRNIDVADRLQAAYAKFRHIVGTTTSQTQPGSTRVANKANLSGAEFQDIIGEGTPSAEEQGHTPKKPAAPAEGKPKIR
jgi:hypothetical protein